jgi:hypothetical protein
MKGTVNDMEIKLIFLCIMCTSQCFHDIYEDINHNNTAVP